MRRVSQTRTLYGGRKDNGVRALPPQLRLRGLRHQRTERQQAASLHIGAHPFGALSASISHCEAVGELTCKLHEEVVLTAGGTAWPAI